MAKKRPGTTPKDVRISMSLRFTSEEEREWFKAAAKREGFNNLTGWILFHLRKQARETMPDGPGGGT